MRILFTILFLSFNISTFAQITWSAPVAVATNTYSNLHPRITLDGNGDPLVLWGNSGAKKTYLSRWTGAAFSTPATINPASIPVFAASWAGPDIASHGDTVYVVFKQTPEDTNHIYIVRSTDGGQNFAAPVRVDSFVLDSATRFPTVTTDVSGNPIVAFMKFDNTFMNAKWAVAKSTDMGNSFSPDVRVSNFAGGDVCDCCPGHILSSGNNTIVTYRNNLSNIRTIWSSFSTDNAATFNNAIETDTTNWMVMACPSSGPDAILLNDSIYTVYMSGASGSSRVYLNKSVASTQQAIACMPLTGNFAGLSAQNYPRIAHAGTAAAIAWKENANTTTRICLKFSDSITGGFSSAYDTIASGSVENADVAMSEGVVHIVWEDDNSGKVMYRKGTYPLPVSVQNIAANTKPIKVFPNPAHSYFSCSNDIGAVTACTLIDNGAKKTEVTPVFTNGGWRISLAGIAQGIYTVILQNREGQKYSSKLLVE
ncbi:MAG: hypothetical protein BGO69_04155 [Bacteroidetes bacterium 46-16]|nr:MAG: hypothetical protein BGO69_04155 [Bacteroidetes bacterium 46-16]